MEQATQGVDPEVVVPTTEMIVESTLDAGAAIADAVVADSRAAVGKRVTSFASICRDYCLGENDVVPIHDQAPLYVALVLDKTRVVCACQEGIAAQGAPISQCPRHDCKADENDPPQPVDAARQPRVGRRRGRGRFRLGRYKEQHANRQITDEE